MSGRAHNDTRFAPEKQKRHSRLRITSRTVHRMNGQQCQEARWLGVIPHIKGLTGKDYPQLPFSVELLINETTHFRGSFLARRTRPC